MALRLLPAGPHALLVEVDDLDEALALHAEIVRRRDGGWCPTLVDVVPGARTVLLDGLDDPVAIGVDLRSWTIPPRTTGDGPVVEIACTYDGPDLEDVAAAWGVTAAEVVGMHTAIVHRVAFCGFAPGFAYLEGIGSARAVARRSSPRPRVDAGSVGLAGPYTGIYPRPSPGGWNLIGRTEAVLWDLGRVPPALLVPGTGVRFVDTGPTGRAPERRMPADDPPAADDDPPPHRDADVSPPAADDAAPAPGVITVREGGAVGRSVRVLRSGALTTVQDDGRPGLAHLGVPGSGSLDRQAHHLANRLVGNPAPAAVLETTVDGVTLQVGTDTVVAVTGGRARVRVDDRDVGWGVPVPVRAGQRLDVGRADPGVRSYVAVAGGFVVAAVLGSASADLLSGLGPSVLADGAILAVGAPLGAVPTIDMAPYDPAGMAVELVAHPGPRWDWLSEAGRATMGTGTWRVTPDSSRIALRLQGPPVGRRRRDELPSEGLVLGAVQALPDGQLVVFLADHPTTGGYPVVAVIDRRSLAYCAQARPDTSVIFRTS